MKYTPLLFLFILFIACQPNQTDSKANTSSTNLDDKTAVTKTDETVNTASKTERIQVVRLSTPETSYVTAKSGLRVRKRPNLEGERIGVRPYGKKVLITHKTSIPLSVQDEGKTIEGEWMGIESRLVSQGKVETVTGYIFSGFLSKQQPKGISDVNLAQFNGVQQRSGIGGITLVNEKLPRRPNQFALSANDTLRFYKDDLKTVFTIASHWFLHHGGKPYISPDKNDCRDRYNKRINYSSELGMGNFAYVKEIKDGFAHLGYLCDESVWIKLDALPDFAKFQSHIEIFSAQPDGGGWEKGYTYIGSNNVLRASPDLDAKAVVNKVLPNYEIHLLGPIKNNWAKVKVKEAKQIFGEMYYKESIYKKTWEGWMMIVEPDGIPLIEPHVFGC